MQVMWNGEALESFQPERGIRQGDPISPYLFVVCLERLSQMIGTAVELGLWKPIKLRRVSPELSHLTFADDLILFAEASLDQVEVISTCLNMFAKCSGQRVNKEKTRMFFSNNVHDTVRQQISDGFGFQRAADLGRYLGVRVGQHGS